MNNAQLVKKYKSLGYSPSIYSVPLNVDTISGRAKKIGWSIELKKDGNTVNVIVEEMEHIEAALTKLQKSL